MKTLGVGIGIGIGVVMMRPRYRFRPRRSRLPFNLQISFIVRDVRIFAYGKEFAGDFAPSYRTLASARKDSAVSAMIACSGGKTK